MQPGCPHYVIASSDQPTYRMIVKIWRNSYLLWVRRSPSESMAEDLRMHKWVIPFPRLFHIEKRSIFPMWKEMFHGIAMEELAACSGLWSSQSDNILKHSQARNNRAVLFITCAVMILYTSEIVQTEPPDLKDAVENFCVYSSRNNAPLRRSRDSTLLRCTNQKATDETFQVGFLMRKHVHESFSQSPNAQHIFGTVLFACLFPTVCFHVFSRTGHMAVIESFWLRLNHILHTWSTKSSTFSMNVSVPSY